MLNRKTQAVLTWLILIGGLLPFLWKLPYMAGAWQKSPMDRFDWVFLLIAAIALLGSLRELIARRSRTHGVYLLVLIPSLLLIAGAVALDIHAAAIMGAVGFAWSALWLALGWRAAYTAFPIYVILALSCTSTRYWLGYFAGPLQWDGLAIKAVLAILMLIWLAANLWRERPVRRENFSFFLAFTALCFGAWQAKTIYHTAPPFRPDFTALDRGDYFGRPMDITPADERFFGTSDLGKFIFASDLSLVNVLAVRCLDDVHQIHPASHCLRVSGWTIDAEHIVTVDIAGQQLMVSEIIARREHQQIMVWVWYSSKDVATGNFLGFRRLWRQGEPWHTYQISTPCAGDPASARAVLQDFLATPPN